MRYIFFSRVTIIVMAALILTLISGNIYAQTYNPFGDRASMNMRTTECLDESTRNLINEKFGEIGIHYIVFFDFIGRGEYSIVIFGSQLGFFEDHSEEVRISSGIFAIINGEPHRFWLGAGSFGPRIVVPFIFWDGVASDFRGRPSLLFFSRNLAGNDTTSVVTFDGNYLQVYWLRPERAQPLHWTWLD